MIKTDVGVWVFINDEISYKKKKKKKKGAKLLMSLWEACLDVFI